eukprot:836291-Amphidinium_carterae.1
MSSNESSIGDEHCEPKVGDLLYCCVGTKLAGLLERALAGEAGCAWSWPGIWLRRGIALGCKPGAEPLGAPPCKSGWE